MKTDHKHTHREPDGAMLPYRDDQARPALTIDRRAFLKLAGFTFTGAVLSGCQPAKVEKAIPLLIKPEEITPGLSYWYATTCAGCSAGCGVLSKNRDGRPIKLEGNPDHPISRGGLCAVGQASLLSLYDSQRLQHPIRDGAETTWEIVDNAITARLEAIKKTEGAVRVLTGTISSPTTRRSIENFLGSFKDGKHVMYDPLSSSAILDAHERTHGIRVLPRFHFEQAEVIAGFDADFLGTWISPVEFTSGYRAGRSLDGVPPKFSYHIQFESHLSLTGSNADKRMRVAPGDIHQMLGRLASYIEAKTGSAKIIEAESFDSTYIALMGSLADRLYIARGRSLVVCGVNNIETQSLVNYINHLLGNYGATINLEQQSNQRMGSDGELSDLLDELHGGKVAALFIQGVNPLYDLPGGDALAQVIKQVQLVVSFAERVDETASIAHFVCPEPHALESWNDAEPIAGVMSVTQPAIQPLAKTRSFIESLTAWSGAKMSAYDLIRLEWEKTVYPRQKSEKDFQKFWDKAVENGFVEIDRLPVRRVTLNTGVVAKTGVKKPVLSAGEYSLVVYPTVAMLDGRHAHNPWLQELPDPVSKIVWDNYAGLSPETAGRLSVAEGDVLDITSTGPKKVTLRLPAHIEQGQDDAVISIALGYGRKGTDRFTNIGPKWIEAQPTVAPGGLVGENAAVFLELSERTISYGGKSVTVAKTGERRSLASSQRYDSLKEPGNLADAKLEPRSIIQEATLAAYAANPSAGSFPKSDMETMWKQSYGFTVHHWGMAIDLTACTGCSACVVGCMAENNIPVVGKDEVGRRRDLNWIHIDRYYSEDENEATAAHQPMLCQHCADAPCETVCPVLATVHSDEGLNQQIYNRCVGTRYCANNCPYKVRHFNWFEYSHGDDMMRMVLNPDVVVRERGVMEKCSMCIQRIEEGKIIAKKEGRAIRDGEIKPACQQSCPAKAIVFGDLNDPKSEISKRIKDPRFYHALEEVGTRPAVGYMTLVRNREDKQGEPERV